MFGYHDFETAQRIAAEKSVRDGRRYEVIPSHDGKYTIGIPIGHSTMRNVMQEMAEDNERDARIGKMATFLVAAFAAVVAYRAFRNRN